MALLVYCNWSCIGGCCIKAYVQSWFSSILEHIGNRNFGYNIGSYNGFNILSNKKKY